MIHGLELVRGRRFAIIRVCVFYDAVCFEGGLWLQFGYINMLSKKASKIALEIYPGKPEYSLKPFF